MQDSIFTKIINGEIPSHKIYEDEKTFVFLDIHPSVQGHTLVIPKKQVEFLWDLDDTDYQSVMATAKNVAQRLKEVLKVQYVGVKVVGTDVPHAHVHLIPFSNENEFNKASTTDDPDHGVLAALAKKLAF